MPPRQLAARPNKKKLKGKKKAAPNGMGGAKVVPIETLCAQAEECIDSLDYPTALTLLDKAYSMDPINGMVLDLRIDVCMEMGMMEEADKMLMVRKDQPDCPHATYMYLGQVNNGEEAMHYFKKGVKMLETLIAQVDRGMFKNLDRDELSRELSTALCTMAELYLTDQCFEKTAEEDCLSLLEKSVAADTTNPEPYQLMASFRLSQNKCDVAKEYMDKTLALLKELDQPPSPEFRFTSATLLMEIGRDEDAAEIFDRLLQEDDTNIDAWYLLAVCYQRIHDFTSAVETLNGAQEMLMTPECVEYRQAYEGEIDRLLGEILLSEGYLKQKEDIEKTMGGMSDEEMEEDGDVEMS